MSYQLRMALTKQAHVWIIHVKSGLSDTILERYKAILSIAELSQYYKFHFERDRYQYLIAHANLRIILSNYVDIEPQDWSFKRNKYGRPEISENLLPTGLRFSMSHCPGLIAFLVSDQIDCGIDVECNDRIDNPLETAQSIFSPFEIRELQRRDSKQNRQIRFFEYWTLKEAFGKALGMGLSIPLKEFSFIIEAPNQIQIDFANGLKGNPLVWQFILEYPTENHILAVALRRGYDSNLTLIQRDLEMGLDPKDVNSKLLHLTI